MVLPELISKKEPCKGRFYRYTQSAYRANDGSVQTKETFKLLKRDSCKGCEKCGWIEEDIAEVISWEEGIPVYDTFQHGDTAYWFTDGYRDYEYGWQSEESGFKKVGGDA